MTSLMKNFTKFIYERQRKLWNVIYLGMIGVAIHMSPLDVEKRAINPSSTNYHAEERLCDLCSLPTEPLELQIPWLKIPPLF
jgi:hypothetical protein